MRTFKRPSCLERASPMPGSCVTGASAAGAEPGGASTGTGDHAEGAGAHMGPDGGPQGDDWQFHPGRFGDLRLEFLSLRQGPGLNDEPLGSFTLKGF